MAASSETCQVSLNAFVYCTEGKNWPILLRVLGQIRFQEAQKLMGTTTFPFKRCTKKINTANKLNDNQKQKRKRMILIFCNLFKERSAVFPNLDNSCLRNITSTKQHLYCTEPHYPNI